MALLLWCYQACLIMIIGGTRDVIATYTRTVTYENQVLVKCIHLEKNQINALTTIDEIDIWKVDKQGNVDFRISRDLFAIMEDIFPSCIMVGNIERLVRRAERQMQLQRNAIPGLYDSYSDSHQQEWFKKYHSYTDIVQWWEKLSEDNPDEVTFIKSIGKSYEGRDMPAVVVTSSSGNPNTVYFQCLIHAREWISATTCMYFINYLMENKENDRIRNILSKVRFVVVPIVNPDGYEYSWTTDRLWRKNRRPGCSCNSSMTRKICTGIWCDISFWNLDKKSCGGIDLNRNFDYHWGEGVSSISYPCSELYQGSHAASEVETQNIVKFFRSLGNVVAALDWHSFGQMILRPYGWTIEHSPDETRLKYLSDIMSEILSHKNVRYYSSKKTVHLSTMGGVASDWFYSDMGNINNSYRAASFIIELPDTGYYGFLPPASEIIPVGTEWIAPILWLVEDINENPILKIHNRRFI